MSHKSSNEQSILVNTALQQLHCYEDDVLYKSYPVSTAKNGLGEQAGSECTPRGWHQVYSIIGQEMPINSVFIARTWTGEYYSPELAAKNPTRDWILTRIIQLDGMEPGLNRGDDVDSLKRFIYIHGTPDTTVMGVPGSHGCVRMRNQDMIEFANWVHIGTRICII